MPSETKNALVAFGLCFAIFFGFSWFTDTRRMESVAAAQSTQVEEGNRVAAFTEGALAWPDANLTREEALKQNSRVPVRNAHGKGSINLKGARLDDLLLTDYKKTTEEDSGCVELLSPEGSEGAYYAEVSWAEAGQAAASGEEAIWALAPGSAEALTPETPVTLTWTSAKGVRFERTFSIDDLSMISVTDRVSNPLQEAVSLTPTCLLVKAQKDERRTTSVFEGAIGTLSEGRQAASESALKEVSFDKLRKGKGFEGAVSEGWVGFTDKYWLTSFVFKNDVASRVSIQGGAKASRCVVTGPALTLKAGETLEYKSRLFAGAKVLKTLDHYKAQGVKKFDLNVDFGWFYFLTKPIFYLLQFLYSSLGNMAVAIILLTILSKILTFPLAQSSYQSMRRIKELQPKMEMLKRQYGSDRFRMNQELALLYKREKIKPMAGCLPLLIQMPIFFCLYKVFAISIEMRHAPLGGWIQDLAAPDPTSLFNLFGLLPWTPPAFLQIGVLPLIMGATMILQQKLTPQATDPAQAKMMYLMPLIFLFMFASFPSGLVLYWTVSNILAIVQQGCLQGKRKAV